MSLTRKYYRALAVLLGENGVSPSDSLTQEMCIYLKGDNPRFDWDKFREAVGDAYTK
jgi:hypothetical protein